MSATDWMVIVAGLGLIGWVNWYFFVAPRHAAATVALPSTGAGPAEVRIVVRGGYDPATVRVPAGKPVRLLFDRQETSPCSEEVVPRLRDPEVPPDRSNDGSRHHAPRTRPLRVHLRHVDAPRRRRRGVMRRMRWRAR